MKQSFVFIFLAIFFVIGCHASLGKVPSQIGTTEDEVKLIWLDFTDETNFRRKVEYGVGFNCLDRERYLPLVDFEARKACCVPKGAYIKHMSTKLAGLAERYNAMLQSMSKDYAFKDKLVELRTEIQTLEQPVWQYDLRIYRLAQRLESFHENVVLDGRCDLPGDTMMDRCPDWKNFKEWLNSYQSIKSGPDLIWSKSSPRGSNHHHWVEPEREQIFGFNSGIFGLGIPFPEP